MTAVLDQIGSYDAENADSATSTFGTNPTPGASVLVAVGLLQGSARLPSTTLTDNAMNTYSPVIGGSAACADGTVVACYQCVNPQLPNSGELEVEIAGAEGFFPSIQAISVNGYIEATASGLVGPGSTESLAITSSTDGDLFLGFTITNYGATGWAPTCNWTLIDEGANSAFLATYDLTSYPTAGAQTWTLTNLVDNASAMVALAIKPSSGGGGGGGEVPYTTPFAPTVFTETSAVYTGNGNSEPVATAGLKTLLVGANVTALSGSLDFYTKFQDADMQWPAGFGTTWGTLSGPGLITALVEVSGPEVEITWQGSGTFEYWIQSQMEPSDSPAFSNSFLAEESAAYTQSGFSDWADVTAFGGNQCYGVANFTAYAGTPSSGSTILTLAVEVQLPTGDTFTTSLPGALTATGTDIGIPVPNPAPGLMRLVWTLAPGITSVTFDFDFQAGMVAV